MSKVFSPTDDILPSEVFVVYHKLTESLSCSDGFSAAMCFWSKYGNDATYVGGFHHKRIDLEQFRDKHVIFVDFAYPVTYMDEIYKVAASMLVIDHHKTTMLELGVRPYVRISLESCACVMSWQLLYGHESQLPRMLMHILDQDTGRHANHHTRSFVQRLRASKESFDTWWTLLDTVEDDHHYQQFIQDGIILVADHKSKCEKLTASAFPITLGGVRGLAVNANKYFSSDVCELLAESSGTFGASFFFRDDTCVEFTLASHVVDVENIANLYHGGGHKQCAGFSMPITSFSSVVDRASKSVGLYINLQTQLAKYCDGLDVKASFKPETLSNHIAENLAKYLNMALGSVADNLEITVSVKTPIEHKTIKHNITCAIAKLLKLPAREFVPKWYHSFFPYIVSRPTVFDEERISELLQLSKTDSLDNAGDFFVTNLYQTVNQRYEATLKFKTFHCVVTVRFPDSSFFVQHSFSL